MRDGPRLISFPIKGRLVSLLPQFFFVSLAVLVSLLFAMAASSDSCLVPTEIFPEAPSSKLKTLNLSHYKNVPVNEEMFPFISYYNVEKRKMYYFKLPVSSQTDEHYKYAVKYALKPEKSQHIRWDKIHKRLQDPISDINPTHKLDTRTGFRVGKETFVVKKEFSFGFRRVDPNTVHAYQIGNNPVYLYFSKGGVPFKPRRLYTNMANFYPYKMKARHNYAIAPGFQYILVTSVKAIFSLQITSVDYMFDSSYIIPTAEGAIPRSRYKIPPPTPRIEDAYRLPSPPKEEMYYRFAVPSDQELMPPPQTPDIPATQSTTLVESPQPDPLLETPQPDPLLETPQPDPLLETPQPDPLLETPQPDPLLETVAEVDTPSSHSPELVEVQEYPAPSSETLQAPLTFVEHYHRMKQIYKDPPTSSINTAKFWRRMHAKPKRPRRSSEKAMGLSNPARPDLSDSVSQRPPALHPPASMEEAPLDLTRPAPDQNATDDILRLREKFDNQWQSATAPSANPSQEEYPTIAPKQSPAKSATASGPPDRATRPWPPTPDSVSQRPPAPHTPASIEEAPLDLTCPAPEQNATDDILRFLEEFDNQWQSATAPSANPSQEEYPTTTPKQSPAKSATASGPPHRATRPWPPTPGGFDIPSPLSYFNSLNEEE